MNDAPLMLSVSGLRGLVGLSLTDEVAAQFGNAIGQWVGQRWSQGADQGTCPHVVLGRDSRPSGEQFEQIVAGALSKAGCKVTCVGIISTPGVGVMVEHLGADAGVIITASHNPIEWNGIKPVVKYAGRIQAPTKQFAGEIIEIFHRGEVVASGQQQPGAIEFRDDTATVHNDLVLKQVDVEAIRARGFKVVVDGVRGAGGEETAALMKALGVELVHLYAEPTGDFPHTPEPVRENLTELCAAVREHGADIGFAQDPDADRLAMVDEAGRYIGEEYTLALACLHVLDRRAAAGDTRGAKLAANLSSSRMIDDVAALHGATVLRTPVGEANVAAVMQDEGALTGGEGNGGVILPQVTYVRDSVTGMALMLEMLAGADQPLSGVVERIPSYSIVKDKVAVDDQLVAQLAPVLGKQFARQRIDLQDGVRIDWPDRWVHVRPSNTEPIVRFIAEATTNEEAQSLIAQVKTALGASA